MKNGNKRIFLLGFLCFSICCFIVLPVFAGQDPMEGEGSRGIHDSFGENLSDKTETELISMERKLKSKLGHEPGNADLYYRLSTVYATLFDRTRTQKNSHSISWLLQSRNALEKVLMIRPEDKVAHYNLGVVYKRLGQMEDAREELKKGIRLCDPQKDPSLICASWFQIGSVYEEQGFFDEAKNAYLRAQEFDYGNENIREALQGVDAKRKAPEAGSRASLLSAPSMGQMLAKTFSGGGEDASD